MFDGSDRNEKLVIVPPPDGTTDPVSANQAGPNEQERPRLFCPIVVAASAEPAGSAAAINPASNATLSPRFKKNREPNT